MSEKNPWANILTRGEMWCVPSLIITNPNAPDEKSLAVFTTLGAASLYLNANGLQQHEPKEVKNLKQLYGLCLGSKKKQITHWLLDLGTDRARTIPIEQAESLILSQLSSGK